MRERTVGFTVVAALWVLLIAAPASGQQPSAVVPDAAATAAAERANASYLAGNYAQALEDFDQALAGGVHDGQTLYRAGHCQQLSKKTLVTVSQTMSRAITELDKVVNLNPTQARLADYDHMSAAYAGVGDHRTARLTAADGIKAYGAGRFGKLIDLTPVEAYHLGRLCAAVGDADLEVEAYGRFIVSEQATPTARPAQLGTALVDVGNVHLKLRRFKKAEAALAMALETMPATRLPGARFAYAVALFRVGKYHEAGLAFATVRLEDPLRQQQAFYAVHVMRTLSQQDLLMDETQPLPDLQSTTQGDLEQMLVSIGTQMAQVGTGVPGEALRRGYVSRGTAPEVRATMHQYRDLKVRMAAAAAEYAARGLEIREFAFATGLQRSLMSWRHLPKRPDSTPPGEIPTSLVGAEVVAEWEAKAAQQRKRREERKAREQQLDDKKATGPKKDN